MGSIFAEKALYGSDAVATNPAKSGRALGSAFRGMRTASCDFIFGTVRSSAVQDRSRNKRPPQSPSPLLKGSQDSKPRFLRRRSRPTASCRRSPSRCRVVVALLVVHSPLGRRAHAGAAVTGLSLPQAR